MPLSGKNQALLFLSVFCLIAGCGQKHDKADGDADSATESDSDPMITDGPCEKRSAQEGRLICRHDVGSAEDWQEMSFAFIAQSQLRESKYVMAVSDVFDVPVTFADVHAYTLHYDLLQAAYSDQFSNVISSQYLKLATSGATRELVVGSIREYAGETGSWFGFTIVDSAGKDLVISFDQAKATLDALQPHFFAPLQFIPETVAQLDAVLTWPDVSFVFLQDAVHYEVYNPGVAFGTIRLLTPADLLARKETGNISHTEILVFNEAPVDIEHVVSGIVTGTRQGMLSHLNVRSMTRNTPNCFVSMPHTVFAEWQDKLVRFECGQTETTIAAATITEAEQFWDNLKPVPVQVPEVDDEEVRLQNLTEIPVADATQRKAAITAYGAKGSNLAMLYRLVDPALQLKGFLIPFSYYMRFMAEQSWTRTINDAPVSRTFDETVSDWLNDDAFRNDSAYRYSQLNALQAAMSAAPVPDDMLSTIGDRMQEIFGDDRTMVRFRSSSNAEDSLSFNGAGLYESTSACLADERDSDAVGPSLCDGDKSKERTLRRALTKVWASLWGMKAFEEREWYGIDHHLVQMAVLVDERVKNEHANIVAFSGHPGSDETIFVINAQAGELDVVSSEAGVYPETSHVHVTGEKPFEIERITRSSEVPDGKYVLTDAHLLYISSVLQLLQQQFPVDVATSPEDYFLDTEWKLNEDGQLIIKQIRPFPR